MPITKETIESALETVLDPCSVSAGVPAGLVSMGMVGAIDIHDSPDGAKVDVTLRMTDPTCMMGTMFQVNATEKLQRLDGVQDVNVSIDYGHLWHPTQMAPDYQERLGEHRKQQRIYMKNMSARVNIA